MELSDNENSVVLKAKLSRFSLSDGLFSFHINDKFFIPLSEIVNGFEFPIVVNAWEGKAKGWFMNEDRQFELDLEKQTATSNLNTFSLSNENVIWGEDDIYIDSKLLDKFFPVETDVNASNLILRIKSLEPLPFEEKIERDRRQKMLNKNKHANPQFSDPFIENTSLFSIPFFDLGTSFQQNTVNDKKENNTSYTLSGNGLLLGLDASLNYFQSTISDSKYARFNVSRFMPLGQLGGVKYFEAGDVSSYNINLISSAKMGRGVNISTFNEKGNAVNRDLNLNGMLTEGWEVELYQDNTLKDFSAGNGEGQYEFNDVPLQLGTNKIKLVFYGAQGERREEEKIIHLSPTSVNKGEFAFRMFAEENTIPLIPLNDQNSSGTQAGGYGEYGVMEDLSITTGLVFYSPSDEIDEEKKFDETRGMLGMKTGFSVFRLGLATAYTENSNSPAFNGIAEATIADYNLFAEHNLFNGMKTEKSYLDSEFIKSSTNLSLRGRIGIPFVGSLPFMTRYFHAFDETKRKYEELTNRLSFSWWKFYLSLESKYKNKFDGFKENLGISTLNFRFGKVSLRGINRYDFINNFLQSISLGADYRMRSNTFLQTNWTRSMPETSEAIDNFTVSVSQPFSFGTFSASSSIDTNENKSFKLSYNTSILNNSKTNEFFVDTPGMAQKSAIVTKSYLDDDYDSTLSPNDKLLPEIDYITQGTVLENKDQKEIIFIKGIKPYELTNIGIKDESIGDMTYHSNEDKIAVLPRKGVATYVNFPVSQLGSIDGELRLRKNENLSYPVSGIKLQLYNNGRLVAETLSDSDGYYTFDDLFPAEYELKLDEAQILILEYIAPAPAYFTIDKEDIYQTIPTIFVSGGIEHLKKSEFEDEPSYIEEEAFKEKPKPIKRKLKTEPKVNKAKPKPEPKIEKKEPAPVEENVFETERNYKENVFEDEGSYKENVFEDEGDYVKKTEADPIEENEPKAEPKIEKNKPNTVEENVFEDEGDYIEEPEAVKEGIFEAEDNYIEETEFKYEEALEDINFE